MSKTIKNDSKLVFFNDGAYAIGNHVSNEVFLPHFNPSGFFGVQVFSSSAGAGVARLRYQISVDGVAASYQIPKLANGTEVGDIVTAHAVGYGQYGFNPRLGVYLKLEADVSGADLTALVVKMAVHSDIE